MNEQQVLATDHCPTTTDGASMDIVLSRWKDHGPFFGFVKMVQRSPFIRNKPLLVLETTRIEGWRLMIDCENDKLKPVADDLTLLSIIQHILLSDQQAEPSKIYAQTEGDTDNNQHESNEQKLPPPRPSLSPPKQQMSPASTLPISSADSTTTMAEPDQRKKATNDMSPDAILRSVSRVTVEGRPVAATSSNADNILPKGYDKRISTSIPAPSAMGQICEAVLANALMSDYAAPSTGESYLPSRSFSSPLKRRLEPQLTQVSRTPLSKSARASQRCAAGISSPKIPIYGSESSIIAPRPPRKGILKTATARFYSQLASNKDCATYRQQAVRSVSFHIPAHQLYERTHFQEHPTLYSPLRKDFRAATRRVSWDNQQEMDFFVQQPPWDTITLSLKQTMQPIVHSEDYESNRVLGLLPIPIAASPVKRSSSGTARYRRQSYFAESSEPINQVGKHLDRGVFHPSAIDPSSSLCVVSPKAVVNEAAGLEGKDGTTHSTNLDRDGEGGSLTDNLGDLVSPLSEKKSEALTASTTNVPRRLRGKRLKTAATTVSPSQTSSNPELKTVAITEESCRPREEYLKKNCGSAETTIVAETEPHDRPKLTASRVIHGSSGTSATPRRRKYHKTDDRDTSPLDSDEASSNAEKPAGNLESLSTQAKAMRVQSQNEVNTPRRSQRLKTVAKKSSFLAGPFFAYNDADVLFCKTYDSVTRNHPGNVKFLGYALHFLDYFDKLHPTDRRAVGSLLVAHYALHHPMVRFLTKIVDNNNNEQLSHGWYHMPLSEATGSTMSVLDKIRAERGRASSNSDRARKCRSTVYNSKKRSLLRRLLNTDNAETASKNRTRENNA